MPETIETSCYGKAKWPWFSVMTDLKEQGGLRDVTVDPLSVDAHGCGGNLEGKAFYITWVYDKFLLLTMEQFSQPLVDAFAKVVGYAPFCRYIRNGNITVEWDKNNPEGRLAELGEEPGVCELVTM